LPAKLQNPQHRSAAATAMLILSDLVQAERFECFVDVFEMNVY